ncbi:dihydrofolate reductase family protein [Thermoactinospora rubra]|uniref:dihydrofolate reductase family protein n=1 Tax=Thermoactinospora rubra TaxID=1088767 RepID=UPI000A11F864|nr:dihydrofolate reductase family protein [Thermoactinospora rubra]
MKPLIVFSDVTVDGFMAGPDNDLDFVVDDPRLEDELTSELMSVADTIVFGRRSFPDSAAYWTAAEGELAAWMNATPKVVLSTDSSFDVSAWENSTLAAGDGADQIRRLKSSSGGALVVFGGVQTVRSLVAANLVDEYWLKFNPAIVGRGGSMFSDVAERRPLTLRSARSFPSGTVAVIYST